MFSRIIASLMNNRIMFSVTQGSNVTIMKIVEASVMFSPVLSLKPCLRDSDTARPFKDFIRIFRSFEVLGHVLNSLESCRKTVCCDGEEFTGPEYRSHLINKICSVRFFSNLIVEKP
jgi:hypothetical protein